MPEVLVEKPMDTGKAVLPPPEEPVDMDLEAPQEEDEDLYTKLKTLQRQLEFYEIQVPSAPLLAP
jgi:hypothetical protein